MPAPRGGNNSSMAMTSRSSDPNSSVSKRGRKKAVKPFQFSRYIFRVLNQIHPSLSLTKKAMKVMDDFMLDVYSRLVSEAAGLVKVTGKATLTSAEFQTATKLLLPGELAKHAVSEATKAVAHFMQSKSEDKSRRKVTTPSGPLTTIEVEVRPSASALAEDSPAPTDEEEEEEEEDGQEIHDATTEQEESLEQVEQETQLNHRTLRRKGRLDVMKDSEDEKEKVADKEKEEPQAALPSEQVAKVPEDKEANKDAEGDQSSPRKKARLEEQDDPDQKQKESKESPDEPDSASEPSTEPPSVSETLEETQIVSDNMKETTPDYQSAIEATPEKEESSSSSDAVQGAPCTVTVKYTRVTSTTTTKSYSIPCEEGEELLS